MKVFEVSKPLVFRDYLKVLTTIRDEHNLELTQDGLTVMRMDLGHVEMLRLELPMQYFDRWDVVEPVKMCLNVDELNRVLKRMNKQDSYMQLDYDHERTRATFTLVSDIRRNKSIPVLESLEEEIPSPKIFFKSKTRMILSTFKRILEDFKENADHFKLETTWNQIKFSTDSDYSHESTPIDKDNDNILDHRVEEESMAHYEIEHLLDFVKAACKVSEIVNIEFSDSLPLKLDVELPQGSMVYYLAPMIGV